MSRPTLKRRWEKVNGTVPQGMCLCHHCDQPRCVNFDHIFVATQGENIRDAAAKGRLAGGRGVKGMKRSDAFKAKVSAGRRRGVSEGRDRWAF